jgi:uncharacterized membrane protein YphA (DoxX/SURF4 family)
MLKLFNGLQNLMDAVVRGLDFLGPLALRIYLAPLFILSGYNKLSHIEDLVPWFASMGIPAPEVMVWLAALTEFFGGIALVAGLAVRWFAIPLMITMIVAATSAHWDNGWHALPETQLTMPWEWRSDLIEEANVRRERAKDILREHSNYGWITSAGSITILKNGIEFAATYFVMLLALFFLGAGRFFSLDYWIARRFRE